ncbi:MULTISPECIES: DarT ssDNA thymidine ADP-ribosyltransferase family protein [Methylobacterium]|nr:MULTISPECIES: DarT ssDNA thymidine ADP-ribosyltransferase family protein [Methylobacterium]MCI9882295.1 DUF4433 domain-containing protein [Methylobacterium goesingense]
MTRRAPANPKIYHVTHVDNLPNIIRDGRLYSDSVMVEEAKACTSG